MGPGSRVPGSAGPGPRARVLGPRARVRVQVRVPGSCPSPELMGPIHIIYLLYLMECFKYAFNILVVSDGVYSINLGGLQASWTSGMLNQIRLVATVMAQKQNQPKWIEDLPSIPSTNHTKKVDNRQQIRLFIYLYGDSYIFPIGWHPVHAYIL